MPILGVRERGSKDVRELILADPSPSVPLVIPRNGRPDTELQAKEVKLGDRRYIVCRNLVEAAQAARTREAVLTTLRAKLRQGDKSLVGNSAYRRYLKTPDQQHFTIDEARVAEDARYDGLYVLRTNLRLHPLNVMLRYRDLLVVEHLSVRRKLFWRHGRSITRPMRRSAGMCSAVFWLSCCARNGKNA
jgi:hypothetical protein